MILSVTSQSVIFFMSVALGLFAGFVYDLFRILRKTVRHPDFLTQLEDFIYWVFVSGLVFYFVLNKNSGEMRFYIILGAFLGMGLYFLTLSRPVMAVSLTVTGFLKQSMLALIKMLSLPVKLLLMPLGAAGKRVVKLRKPAKKLLQKPAKYAKIKSRGFLRELRIMLRKV